MARNTPTWQLRGMDAPPPVVNGYHDYGTVYDPERDGRPSRREVWSNELHWGLWSWMYWGKKVRRDIEFERAAGNHDTLSAQAFDLVALALVRFTAWLYRPRG